MLSRGISASIHCTHCQSPCFDRRGLARTFEQQLIRTFCHRPLPVRLISLTRRDRTGRNLGGPPLADALVGSIRSPCLSAASPAKRKAFGRCLVRTRRDFEIECTSSIESETFPRNYRHWRQSITSSCCLSKCTAISLLRMRAFSIWDSFACSHARCRFFSSTCLSRNSLSICKREADNHAQITARWNISAGCQRLIRRHRMRRPTNAEIRSVRAARGSSTRSGIELIRIQGCALGSGKTLQGWKSPRRTIKIAANC